MHVPSTLMPSLTLITGSSLSNIAGSILTVFFYNLATDAYTYTVENSSFNTMYQTYAKGCILTLQNYVTAP
jgi:hypothetical protein